MKCRSPLFSRLLGPLLCASSLVFVGCSGGSGTIRGELGARGATSGSQALTQVLTMQVGGETGVSRHALRFAGVSIELVRVGSGDDPQGWEKVAEAQAEADGTFAFKDVEEGRYALRLVQPEFGSGLAADSTEFEMTADQVVTVVLPLYSSVIINPLFYGSTAAAVEEGSGRIHVATAQGWAAIEAEQGTAAVMRSSVLFQNIGAVALLPQRGEILFIGHQRLIRAPLAALPSGAVIDLDALATRGAGIEGLVWAAIPTDRRLGQGIGFTYPETQRKVWVSGDEAAVYFSYANRTGLAGEPIDAQVAVIDVETLTVPRIINGNVMAYNPVSDRLYFGGGSGPQGGNQVLVVDASARRDVGVAMTDGMVVGAAAVPGSSQAVVISTQTASSDAEVPFATLVEADAQIAMPTTRVRDWLGVKDDPVSGLPAYSAAGDYFTLGSQAFRRAGDEYTAVRVKIPPGDRFQKRLACANQRAVDPVNKYEIWYGVAQGGGACPWVGLVPLDQYSVPVAMRAAFTLLDAPRGRVLDLRGVSMGFLHYADRGAADRPEVLDLSAVGAALLPPAPATCNDSQPCPGTELCLGTTDTAWTGTCTANPATPYLARCGGLTRLACDPGRTCELSNPTNDQSPGICTGLPPRDYAAQGPLCSVELPCAAGLQCNDTGHCEPELCLRDADCDGGEVCGMIEWVGRVCLPAGPLPDGAICFASSECAHGACVPMLGQAPFQSDPARTQPQLSVCTRPCFANSDCQVGTVCAQGVDQVLVDPARSVPWCTDPVAADCTATCGVTQWCQGDACAAGFAPPRLPLMDPNGTCLPPWSADNLGYCALGCQRNRDCPWAADCLAGFCGLGQTSPPRAPYECAGGAGCQADEMCASFQIDFNANVWTCMDGDPCHVNEDCQAPAICLGVCSESCAVGSDCPTGWECTGVDFNWPTLQCFPPLCGCTGAEASTAICRYNNLSCHLPRWCAAACDDSNIDAACRPGDPLGLASSGTCRCPACAWNVSACTTCPSWESCPTGVVSPCPAEYTCTLDAGKPFGQSCACVGSACQTP